MFKKGNKINLGRKHTEETRKRMSDAHKGKPSCLKGKHFSLKTRNKMSISAKKSFNSGRFKIGSHSLFAGKHHTDESKQKISEKRKTMDIVPWNKGKHPIGKKWTQEQKIQYRKIVNRGDKCWNWKGGITKIRSKIWHSPEYKEWRTAVFERDQYICQKCGIQNGDGKTIKLEAHHIKEFYKYPELRFNIDNGITLCKECHIKIQPGRPKKVDLPKKYFVAVLCD